MFIRVMTGKDGRELLINVNHISTIEIKYSVQGEDGSNWRTDPQQGLQDPAAERWFKFKLDGEDFLIKADPNDPVTAVFDQIYKDAIKN